MAHKDPIESARDRYSSAIYMDVQLGSGTKLLHPAAPVLYIDKSNFQYNDALYGGAVYMSLNYDVRSKGAAATTAPYHVQVTSTTFRDNSAAEGGAVFLYGLDGEVLRASFINCTFDDNMGPDRQSTVCVRDSHWGKVNNVARRITMQFRLHACAPAAHRGDGGTLFGGIADIHVASSSFTGGLSTGGAGGCIFSDGSGGFSNSDPATFVLTVKDSDFSGCRSISKGGAIYVTSQAPVTVDSCAFTENASALGGALCHQASNGAPGRVTVMNSTFRNNMATERGGAVFTSDAAVVEVLCDHQYNSGSAGPAFFSNRASSGGALAYSSPPGPTIRADGSFGVALLRMRGCAFEGNEALELGGAVHLDADLPNLGTNLDITGVVFGGNKAASGGGMLAAAPLPAFYPGDTDNWQCNSVCDADTTVTIVSSLRVHDCAESMYGTWTFYNNSASTCFLGGFGSQPAWIANHTCADADAMPTLERTNFTGTQSSSMMVLGDVYFAANAPAFPCCAAGFYAFCDSPMVTVNGSAILDDKCQHGEWRCAICNSAGFVCPRECTVVESLNLSQGYWRGNAVVEQTGTQ
ncbi:hypothetical protein JKP88DRAFT_253973, partial [Tribonema minus]